MALNGSFVLNGADYSPLTFPGVGTFMAFSGSGEHRNNIKSAHIAKHGPLPPGRYWIVDREQGGLYAQTKAATKDLFNRVFSGAQFSRTEWFALMRDDYVIDDWTWFRGVERGLFRLHPGTISEGCITLHRNSDFALIRDRLMNTFLIDVPCRKNLKARGLIEVKA